MGDGAYETPQDVPARVYGLGFPARNCGDVGSQRAYRAPSKDYVATLRVATHVIGYVSGIT